MSHETEIRERLTEAVYQAIGEGSACWENLSGAGEFDSTHAAEVGARLMDRIVEVIDEVTA